MASELSKTTESIKYSRKEFEAKLEKCLADIEKVPEFCIHSDDYISNDDLLKYMETTGMCFKITVNENDWQKYTDYDIEFSKADKTSIEHEYWPCYTR